MQIVILQCWISDKKSSSLSFSKDIDTYCQCYRIGQISKLQISVDAGDCGCILRTASWSLSTCSSTYSYVIVQRNLGFWLRIKKLQIWGPWNLWHLGPNIHRHISRKPMNNQLPDFEHNPHEVLAKCGGRWRGSESCSEFPSLWWVLPSWPARSRG